MSIDPIIKIVSALVLSYIFVLAGLHKLQNILEFRGTLENYQLFPRFLLLPLSFSVPVTEIISGIGLLVPFTSKFAAFLIAALLCLYIFAIGINLLRNRRNIDCGCLGPLQRQTLSEWLIVRNLLLVGLAYCVMETTISRQLDWFDWVAILLATATTCLFYNIGNQLLVNKDKLKLLRSNHG